MNPDSTMKTARIDRSVAVTKNSGVFFALIVLFMMCKTAQAGNLPGRSTVFSDSITVRIQQFKKPIAFELYPDVSQQVLLFTAKGEKGKVYQLFLFDITGNLIRQTQVRSKETGLLSNFLKGDYTFAILCDDERIGNGNIAIR